MSALGNQPFSVTGVISQSFAVLRGNLGGFLLIALIVVIVMAIAVTVVGGIFFGGAMMAGMAGRFPDGDMSSMSNMDMMSLGITAVIGSLLILVLILAIEQLGVAAITYGTVQDLRGRKALVGECLSRGLSLMLPVLGVALLYTLIVAVVPGIVGYVLGLVSDLLGRAASTILQVGGSLVLYVAIPAAVIEGTGAIGSLQRSADLTQGYRWRLLGMFILVGLILLMAAAVVGIVIYAVMSISAVLGGIVIALGGIAMTLLFIAYVAALPAVTYYNLRVAKEGTDITEIAKVFD